jgi:RNA methyltransferase, TrmH family
LSAFIVRRIITASCLGDTPLLVVADGVERPGNLGAIVRTACGAGADAIVATDAATDLFHPDAVHGSVGALFHVRFAEVRRADAVAALRARGARIVVATPNADRLYWDGDFRGAVAVVVGSERHGVAETWLGAADDAVRIPMGDGADSLNVTVAAGVVLFEAARQRASDAPAGGGAVRPARRRRRPTYSATYSRSR